MVSVIMPAYNSGKYIKDAISSVLEQTYADFELLIVNDASEDDTEAVVQSFNDDRIRYFKNNQSMGAAICRNSAIRHAKGEFIAFLDSDDLWKPEKLEKQLAFMMQNNCAFSYTAYEEMNESGEKSGRIVSGPKKVTRTGMYTFCWPGCLTVMYNRNVVGDLEIYPIERNNDYAMWLKIIKKANLHLLEENLAVYRRRQGSVSGQKTSVLLKYHYLLYRLCDGKSVISSIGLTLLNIAGGIYKKIRYVKKSDRGNV